MIFPFHSPRISVKTLLGSPGKTGADGPVAPNYHWKSELAALGNFVANGPVGIRYW